MCIAFKVSNLSEFILTVAGVKCRVAAVKCLPALQLMQIILTSPLRSLILLRVTVDSRYLEVEWTL